MMLPAPKHGRRLFRFSLGTMFAVVAVLAIVIGYHVNWIHQRHAALREEGIELLDDWDALHGGPPPPRAPGLLWLFGERGCGRIRTQVRLMLLGEVDNHPLARYDLPRLFPEATFESELGTKKPAPQPTMLNAALTLLSFGFGISLIVAIYYMFVAAQWRRSGVNFGIACRLPSLLFRPTLYHEEAKPARRRFAVWFLSAVICLISVLISAGISGIGPPEQP